MGANMLARSSVVVLVLGLAGLVAPATAIGQDSKVSAATPAKNPVEVRFTDGGIMRMAVADEYLELLTSHGKLKIAVANVRRLELATRLTEATHKLIAQCVVDLGNPQFRVREKASAELLALREKAYPAVSKVSKSTDAEVAKRANELLEKIRAKVPASRLKFREKDVVYTTDSTITGRLDLTAFSAMTAQFGPVQLKVADAASIHFLSAGAEIEVSLDGRYAISTEVWLDTGVEVTEQVNLTIIASGEIDMYATDGYVGQYVGTPKGKKAWPGSTGQPLEPGTLIGRIGESGKVFVVKDQFDEFAPASGRLYLRAAGNPYNVRTTGSYSIRIQGGVPVAAGAARTDPQLAVPNDAVPKNR